MSLDKIEARDAEAQTPPGCVASPTTSGGEPSAAGVYVASRASVPERSAMWRRLRDRGEPISSTWIDEAGQGDTAELDELWSRICREVTGARHLIMYVEPSDFPLKGAFVEVGMALAARVPITIVAPDVEIEGRNCRPFGSWIRHPLVTFAPDVVTAFAPEGAADLYRRAGA